MMKTNYHTHCFYCDGTGTPENYVLEAEKRGLSVLGFSSHSPVPFDTSWNMKKENLPLYREDVRKAEKSVSGKLQVYLGLEVDYLRGLWGPDDLADEGLDYIIGAVHMLKHRGEGEEYLSVDGPDEEFEALYTETYGRNIKNLVKDYYTMVCELMERHSFDFLAHFDLVKKKNRNNRYFDEQEAWYRACALEALTLASEKQITLEINSGGISRGAIDTVYPGPWLLSEAHRLSVPLVISADAHRPEHLDFHFHQSAALCRQAGYRNVRVYLDGQWQDTGL
ncbi:MAG: histidinol-phosphatase [Spirochaetales bacterium]|nr:histidinol-phosphatase [Spirochaetales bacterium]